MAKRSELEREFETRARQMKLPDFEIEHRFAQHIGRQWRFDFAWPERMVAVEMEGGTYTGGRHVRGSGFAKDCEKYNAAAMLGWVVLRFTGDMLRKDPVGSIEMVKLALEEGA